MHGKALVSLYVGEYVGSSFGPDAVARNQATIFDSQLRGLATKLTETQGLYCEK